MTAGSKMDSAVNDRINKEKLHVWLKNENYVSNKAIADIIKLRLYSSLTVIILLCGLHILPLNAQLITKLQRHVRNVQDIL